MNNKENNDLNWLKNIPENIRLPIFLILKIAILVFHNSHVNLKDFSLDLTKAHWLLKGFYYSEMLIHLIVIIGVNVFLIKMIRASSSAVIKILESDSRVVISNDIDAGEDKHKETENNRC